MKRSHLLTPARIEERSASAQKRVAQLKQRKLADLGLDTPMPKPRKSLLYANISTPQEELRIEDGMLTDEEDDEDQLFTKKDSKMMVSEISTAINETLKEALKPMTQRILKLEARMSKIENNMSDIISDEAFNAVADYLGQFDLKIEKMDEKINKCEAANKNREKKDDEIKQIKDQMAKFKVEPTSNGASSASALFEENSEEIKESGRKLELTFPMKLEKAVAIAAAKRVIADTGKSLDNLEGEIEEESFFSNDSHSKVVVAFEDVPTRKEAQAVVCLTREGKRWRGSKLKYGSENVRVVVQKPPFARRRDKKLHNARDLLVRKNEGSDWTQFPIDYEMRTISHMDKIVAKQQQLGMWNVMFI